MSIPEKELLGFQTDVRRRTNLSTTTNALRSMAEGPNEGMSMSSQDFLKTVEDEMNRIVDRDVETLVEGMEEIVDLSMVREPSQSLNSYTGCSSFLWSHQIPDLRHDSHSPVLMVGRGHDVGSGRFN